MISLPYRLAVFFVTLVGILILLALLWDDKGCTPEDGNLDQIQTLDQDQSHTPWPN